MAEFILSYYKGNDDYSDGDNVENFLLETARKGLTFDDISIEDRSWPVYYHMTSVRENICSWYPFKEHASVLEIGAGCGAITGILCKKAEKVTAVELSKRRALINYERNKKYDNLRVIVGNINDISEEEKYDYITLIGVLEYAGRYTDQEKPFHAFIENIKGYLKEDGIILIAIENRLGLKYFCGAAEDHTNRIYEGINNYPHYDGVRTFSKEEIIFLLNECGLNYQQFYYPYPDYKLPQEIYTDQILIKNLKPYNTFDQDRLSLFYESDLFNTLNREGVFSTFANSFFIEASQCDISHEEDLLYAKFNNERGKKYQIGTIIYEKNGERLVKKYALDNDANEHVLKIFNNTQINYGHIHSVPAKCEDNRLIYSYLSDQGLDHVIACELRQLHYQTAITEIKKFFSEVFVDQKNYAYDTPQFHEWFGDSLLEEKELNCILPANIDIIPSNVFRDEDSFQLIDCEWVAEFPVPVEFLKWRFVYVLYVQFQELKSLYSFEKIIQDLDISSDHSLIFIKWETYFERNYVGTSEAGCPKNNQLITLEYGLKEKLQMEINQLEAQVQESREYSSRLQTQVLDIREYALNLEVEVSHLKQRVNYFAGVIEQALIKIEELSRYKTFKFLHFKNRIQCQLLAGDKEERSNFWKWLKLHHSGSTDSDRRFTPFIELEQVLTRPVDNVDNVFYRVGDPMTILATKHTVYIAKLLEHCLLKLGIMVNICTEEPEKYGDEVHIIICPQMFKHFPSRYIAFQMEQTVSSRWLSDEYFNILMNAYAVFDYSLVNIDYFKKNTEFGKMFYYLPVDFLPEAQRTSQEFEYDVVFYGDPNNERRRLMLDKLSNCFNVKIISEVFGEELYKELSKAKIIINIHYYENALLETTRIYEALSLGTSIIISERSNDPKEEERLNSIVEFVPIDDIEAMAKSISYWLEHDEERIQKLNYNNNLLNERANAFEYYFYRFMLANDWMSFDDFYQIAGRYIQFSGNRVCLSLPEDVERRTAFDSDNHYGFEVFPGLRHKRGWTGCGLSYKFIMKKAKEQQLHKILVCEDDVFFPDDFESRFDQCLKYLKENDNWDIFQGLMANVSDVEIKKLERSSDQIFAYLSRMMSMVFNLYDENVYPYIIAWDYTNDDVENNTIDRALEARNLNIVATVPFLVGHKEDLTSSIWNFKNSQYNDLIMESSKKLSDMVAAFEERHSSKNI